MKELLEETNVINDELQGEKKEKIINFRIYLY